MHRFMYRHAAAYLVDGDVWQVAKLCQREAIDARDLGIRLIAVFDGTASQNKAEAAEEDARPEAHSRGGAHAVQEHCNCTQAAPGEMAGTPVVREERCVSFRQNVTRCTQCI